MERDDLSSLLQQLTSEGLLDSGGHFTLDSKKAWDKARELRFADPGQYLRCLYRGAVLGEATQVDFYVDSDDTILSFDGPPLGRSQLLYLVASLYVEETSWCARKLQQLALGVHGAWAQGYAWAEVHSPEAAFRYSPDRPEPESIPPALGKRTNTIRLKRPFGGQVIARYLTHKYAEDQVLFAGLGWSDVTTTYNGRELARNYCRQGQFRLDVGLPDSLRLVSREPAQALDPQGCIRDLSLVFDLLPGMPKGKLNLLVADVEVPREYELSECPGLSALVAVGPMLLDASQMYVVENDDFRELLGVVEQAWAQGVVEANRTKAGRQQYRTLLPWARQVLEPGSPLEQRAEVLLLTDDKPKSTTKNSKPTSPPLASKRSLVVRQADFTAADRDLESLRIPLTGHQADLLCFQRESRLVLLVKNERIVESYPMRDLVEMCAWEERERVYLRLDFGLRELDFWQPVTQTNRSQARALVEQLLRSSQCLHRCLWSP